VVQRLVLEEGHVEFVGHQRLAEVARQCRVAGHRRQVARAALIGGLVAFADPQREGRVVVEEERGHVIVVDDQQHVGLFLRQPLLHRLVSREDGRPRSVLLLVGVQREADGRVWEEAMAPMMLAMMIPVLSFCCNGALAEFVHDDEMAASVAGTARMAITALKPQPIDSSTPPAKEPKMLPKRPMPSIQLTPVARTTVG
jgi:hypothetical protein